MVSVPPWSSLHFWSKSRSIWSVDWNTRFQRTVTPSSQIKFQSFGNETKLFVDCSQMIHFGEISIDWLKKRKRLLFDSFLFDDLLEEGNAFRVHWTDDGQRILHYFSLNRSFFQCQRKDFLLFWNSSWSLTTCNDEWDRFLERETMFWTKRLSLTEDEATRIQDNINFRHL